MCPRTDRLGARGSSMGLHWAGIGVRVESIGAWRAGVSSPAVLSGRIVGVFGKDRANHFGETGIDLPLKTEGTKRRKIRSGVVWSISS